MNEISDILKRSKFSNLMSYLIYGVGENGKIIENYDSSIDESYETFFTEIETLYSDADREDDRLFDIISEFACVHDDIYFEAGILVGCQLYKEMVGSYEYHANEIADILKRKKSSHDDTEYESHSILESFCLHRLDTALEESIRNDKDYQKKDSEVHTKIMRIDKIGLTHKQWKIVDSALSACNARNSIYGEKAYMQGFKDIVNLLMEVTENS